MESPSVPGSLLGQAVTSFAIVWVRVDRAFLSVRVDRAFLSVRVDRAFLSVRVDRAFLSVRVDRAFLSVRGVKSTPQVAESHRPDDDFPLLIVEFERRGKTRATRCRPVVPSRRRGARLFFCRIRRPRPDV